MTSFLVEVYLPRADTAGVDRYAADASATAERMTREGVPVQYVRAIFVPDDETCFLLFEARTREDVLEAVERAGLPKEHLAVAIVQPANEEVRPAGREA